MKKESIYLEAEDDITAVIEKVKDAKTNIIALVPPKRMPVLQSSVNLKLLKKEAASHKKKIVLVTSEASLLPLAGSVGLHVADTLNTKPYIPKAPDAIESDIELSDSSAVDAAAAAAVPVGVLDKAHGEDTDKKDQPKKSAKTEKLSGFLPKMKGRIPNFGKFRTKLILIISGAVLLSILWFVAFYVLPEATVVVRAQTTRVQLEAGFTLDKDAESDDLEEKVLASTTETLKKSNNVTVEATGEKNVGKKATGIVTLENCEQSSPLTVDAGTKVISSSGFSFVMESTVTIPAASFSGGGSICDAGEAPANVTATNGGSDYNLVSGLSYVVSGFSNTVSGTGGKMSGGTDEIETVVSQEDIDNALANLIYNDHSQAQAELEAQFSTTQTPLVETFTVKEGDPKGEPDVGETAKEVIVTLEYTYKMQGVSTESLNILLDEALIDEVGETELEIYDNGLSDADMEINGKEVTLTTNSFVGPSLDADEIAMEIAGLGFSQARDLLKAKDGVNSVDIDLSPFWVFSLPSEDKIEVTIDVAEHALQ